ncbi:MAG: alpha/beta hydrolase [Pseudomonadota bacterium]
MDRLIRKRAFIIALAALALTASTRAVAQAPMFADTDENRERVARAYQDYQRINREHGHYIEVNGIRMHYLEWGSESGVPLIWAHGYSSTAFELVSVAQELVEAGYHVYAVSYRGHGKTQVDDYNFSLSHIADDIASMMHQLNIEKAVVGGLSLGGGVATAFYDHYPDRVLALVLEDGGADNVQVRTERLFPVLKAYGEPMPDFSKLIFEERFALFQTLAGLYMPGWGGSIPPGIAPAFHSWIVERKDGRFAPHLDHPKLLGTGPATIDPARSGETTLLMQSWRRTHPIITYRNLGVPMLIIDPTGDAFDASEDFAALGALHPTFVNVVEYPDTPHTAHPMRPEWFIRDMKNLLDRIESR